MKIYKKFNFLKTGLFAFALLFANINSDAATFRANTSSFRSMVICDAVRLPVILNCPESNEMLQINRYASGGLGLDFPGDLKLGVGNRLGILSADVVPERLRISAQIFGTPVDQVLLRYGYLLSRRPDNSERANQNFFRMNQLIQFQSVFYGPLKLSQTAAVQIRLSGTAKISETMTLAEMMKIINSKNDTEEMKYFRESLKVQKQKPSR
jgi:hypothetical protein